MKFDRRTIGRRGEDFAVDYLTEKGYRILERNFRFERGEIDIVAELNNVLIFIEVKARRTKTYGEPEEAVTPGKQKQIRRIAEGYLLERNIDDRECRFDVIALFYRGEDVTVDHFENAF